MIWKALRAALDRPVFGTASNATARTRRKERGIALLVVVGSLAILTAVAVEYRYQTSVDLQLAANARDELRAEYLARSGIAMSRLLLRFQKQIGAQAATFSSTISGLINAMAPDARNSLPAGINLLPAIQLWRMIPIDQNLFSLLSGVTKSASPLGDGSVFGEFSGEFQVVIQDEESKFNLNRLDGAGPRGIIGMTQGLALLTDPRLAFVFETEDTWRVEMKPQEVLAALHDWIDAGDNQTSINLGSGATPWAEGSGDENRYYQGNKYPHRYRAKNAAFDSLDEIFQVDGVSDLFAAAFYDRLTVWANKNDGLNPNSDDPLQVYLSIVSAAANPNDPKLSISPPSIPISLIFQQLAQLKSLLGRFGGITVQQFIQIIEGQGIAVKPEIKTNPKNNNVLTDKTETFSVKSTGKVGTVEKTLRTVIRSDDVLGKLLYYREE